MYNHTGSYMGYSKQYNNIIHGYSIMYIYYMYMYMTCVSIWYRSTEEVLGVVRDGNASLMTLNQATVLMEKAPSDEDVCTSCVYTHCACSCA